MEDKELFQHMRNKISESYDVGYCKPPKDTQFKKGVSGNPKGRKKKVVPESIKDAIALELTNKIPITNEKGLHENVYLFQVFAKQIIQDALKKDGVSRKIIIDSLSQMNLLYSKQSLEEKMTTKEIDQKKEAEIKSALIKKLDAILKEKENGN